MAEKTEKKDAKVTLSGGGDYMIVGFPSRSGKMDLELLRLGDTVQDAVRLANDAEVGFDNLVVFDDAEFEKLIDSGGFLPDSDYVFVIYRDDEEIIVEYMKIGDDQTEIAVEAEGAVSAFVYPDTNTLLYSEKKNERARCFYVPFGEFETRLGRGDRCYFSPDGSKIFIEEIDDDEYNLTVVDVKSGKETKLISKDDPIEDFIVSSDSEYIVYQEITSSGYQLFIIDTDEGKEDPIGEDYYSILSFQFLPTGHNGFFIAENYDGTLSLIDFEDANTVTSALYLTAMSGPSGKNLIYTVGDEEEENTIYSYNFRNGTSEEILNGKMIVFSILDLPEKVVIFDVDNEDEAVLVYTSDMDGGNLVEVLDEELIDFEGVFHASGQKSIFFLFETEDGMALFATSTDSDTEGYYLVEDWFDIRPLTQSTNDKTLVFAGMEDDGDDFSLYSVEISESGRIIELDDTGDRFVNAVFTPNNKSVLYTVVTGSNPDDVIVNQVSALGEGRSEELFDEAVLVDVAWGDMQAFGFTTWYVVQQGTSYCPGATLLVDGTEVDSELVDEEGTCFRMTAAEGDIVTLAAYTDQPSASFDLIMSLYDRDGVLLAENDDSEWSLDPRLTYTFEDSGIFFVKINERNDGLGEFSIEMDMREDALDDARRIEIDEAESGTITQDSGLYFASEDVELYGDIYYFEGEVDDRVAIDVKAGSRSDLDPFVFLLDADGEQIGWDDNGGDGDDARIFHLFTTAGRVYFIVADANEGQPPASGDDFSYEVSISYREGVSVAILDYGSKSSYFNGDNSNFYQRVVDLLEADTTGFFVVVDVVTDLSPTTLSQYDRLVLPDNGVPDDYLEAVDNWFTSGKTILAIDSAVCYGAYAGYLWSDTAGTYGSGKWGYRSIDGLEIVESSGTTSSFSVGRTFSTSGSDAWLNVSKLPADADLLAVHTNDSDLAGIVERDVSGKGKIVFFGANITDFDDYATLVANALR
jgi:Tol biopolymer transport system component